MIANVRVREIASQHRVQPARCARCHNTATTGLSWDYGYDDGTDADYIGYQCRSCGNVQGLTAGHVARVARSRA